FECDPPEFQSFRHDSGYLDGHRNILLFENAFGSALPGLIDQYLGHMKISIVLHPGHKPDLLPGPPGKLPVSRIPFVEDDPTAGRQFELVQELDVIFFGCRHANKLCHPAKSIHEGMHFDTAFSPGPVQSLAANPTQDLAEQLDGSRVDDL